MMDEASRGEHAPAPGEEPFFEELLLTEGPAPDDRTVRDERTAPDHPVVPMIGQRLRSGC